MKYSYLFFYKSAITDNIVWLPTQRQSKSIVFSDASSYSQPTVHLEGGIEIKTIEWEDDKTLYMRIPITHPLYNIHVLTFGSPIKKDLIQYTKPRLFYSDFDKLEDKYLFNLKNFKPYLDNLKS